MRSVGRELTDQDIICNNQVNVKLKYVVIRKIQAKGKASFYPPPSIPPAGRGKQDFFPSSQDPL
jgi:hypothetical protein